MATVKQAANEHATLPHPPPQQQPGQEKEGVQTTDGAASSTECGEHEDVVERIIGCEIYWSRGNSATISGSESDGEDGVAAGLDGGDAAMTTPDGGVVAELGGGNAAAAALDDGIVAEFEGGNAADAAAAASGAPAAGIGAGLPFLGLMGEDDSGTWIKSQNVGGLEILVKDDLKVWPDHLWVNDRGFDGEGNFVYGNQRGVPYKMRRVAAAGPLEWTLGAEFRTKELYAEKMSAIGVTPGQRFGPPVRQASGTAADGLGGIKDRC